jgi:hypothetical protein
MGTCASGSGNASGSRGWGCRAAAACHGTPRENVEIGALRAVVHAVTRTTHHTYSCPKNAPHSDTSLPQREEPRAAMDTPNMPPMLETWSALRGAYADLPAATIAAIVPQLDPETAARVQAILTAFDQREAPRKAEIAQQEAAITAAVLATGATAHGTCVYPAVFLV